MRASKKVIFDFESRSECNLKTAGGFKYSLHPSTRPTCLAFKKSGRGQPVFLLKFQQIGLPWEQQPESLKKLWNDLIDGGYLFTAHNAGFDVALYKNILVKRYGWPDIPFTQFRCTAAKAAACALPRSLEKAGAALGLSTQKDLRGHIAMLRTCRPTKQWNAWRKLQDQIAAGARISEKKRQKAWEPEPAKFLEPGNDPETWSTLYEYCKIDVLSEEAVDDALPDLNPAEQEIWFLNQRINWRGIRIDIPVVEKIVAIMAVESKKKLKELDHLTMGLVTKPGARRSILEFLALEGIELPDIRAKTVEDTLKGDGLSEDMRRLLEIRKALSKTSTRKYQAFIARANEDDRVRDILLYHGASTGRDSGTGVQFQNLPRPLIKIEKDRPYAAVDNVAECDHEMLTFLYGDTLPIVFSAILRNMMIPSEGCELFVADFSKIEVAVLWWLADNWPGLKILNSGGDPYVYQAMENTGKRAADITENDRQLGKAQILGGGFGMGHGKFRQTALDMYRLELTEEQSRRAISSYRTLNAAVPALWKNYERAAIRAVEEQVLVTVGKCKFFCRDKFLWVELPSGRRLAYREPRISWRENEYGSQKTLEFMAVNSKTKQWGIERTWGGTLTENIVQGVARDVMMYSLPRLEKAGYRVLLGVHDEPIAERKKGEGSVLEFTRIMCERLPWMDRHLPLEAKGWVAARYRK